MVSTLSNKSTITMVIIRTNGGQITGNCTMTNHRAKLSDEDKIMTRFGSINDFVHIKMAWFHGYHYSTIMQLISVLVFALFAVSSMAQQRKVTITKFENCDANANYPIKMAFKIKEENGMQILEEGSISSKVELGNNIKDVADVYSKEDNGEWEHLVTINENLCDAVNKYMGEFMHDLQEKAGLERGACPVPAGDYKVEQHTLDFSNFKFKKIPEGEFRVKVTLIDNNSNETLHCHYLEFKIEK